MADVSRLLSRGYGVRAIARELDISPASAQRWVNKARADIAAEYRRSIADLTELASAHLAELDEVSREAWLAWEKSKRPARVIVERTETGDKDKVTVERRREQRLPDARYLQAILTAQAQAAKIAGVNAPEKVAPVSPDGKREYQGLTDDERASRINTLLERARQARARQADSNGAAGAGEMDRDSSND
jgi:transposase-like protein